MAELIIECFHDAEARRGLQALAAVCADPEALKAVPDLPETFPKEWFDEREGGFQVKRRLKQHAAELGDRSRRAWRVLRARPLDPVAAPLDTALAAAAALFDAGLYFEVHELLEPHWIRAEGHDRVALQGLIQIAVGFQHLANGNVAGARTLLRDGAARIVGLSLEGLDLDPFARGARACLAELIAEQASAPRRFDWARVPRFP